jgi:hypothetical protein
MAGLISALPLVCGLLEQEGQLFQKWLKNETSGTTPPLYKRGGVDSCLRRNVMNVIPYIARVPMMLPVVSLAPRNEDS